MIDIWRNWLNGDLVVLNALQASFSYNPGDKRATGYLSETNQSWLIPLMDELEYRLGIRFTIIAFQGYADGTVGCDWHADTPFDAQAILSLGGSRMFGWRYRGKEENFTTLNTGDLVFMPSGFQKEWEHCIPLQPEVIDERCSLVFRTVAD